MRLMIIFALLICVPILTLAKSGPPQKDAQTQAIVSNKPSPITYNSPKPKEITDEDKLIEVYKINVKPEDVVVVPVGKVFE